MVTSGGCGVSTELRSMARTTLIVRPELTNTKRGKNGVQAVTNGDCYMGGGAQPNACIAAGAKRLSFTSSTMDKSQRG